MGPFLVSEGLQHVPVSRVSVSYMFLHTRWAGSVPTALLRVRSTWSLQSGFLRVHKLSRFSDVLTSFAVPLSRSHLQSRGLIGRIVWSCSVVVCLIPCHLGCVDVQLDLVLRWHVGLLCVDRCSASWSTTNLSCWCTSYQCSQREFATFPLFYCQRLCEFVSCHDGVCGEGILFVQHNVFIVLLCQFCGESRCNGLRVYAVCGCNKVRLPGTGQSAHVIGGSRFTRPASNSRRTLLNWDCWPQFNKTPIFAPTSNL